MDTTGKPWYDDPVRFLSVVIEQLYFMIDRMCSHDKSLYGCSVAEIIDKIFTPDQMACLEDHIAGGGTKMPTGELGYILSVLIDMLTVFDHAQTTLSEDELRVFRTLAPADALRYVADTVVLDGKKEAE